MEAKLKVIICRGLPGSGKTTFAKEYIKKNLFSKTVRINRDDIREMMGITYNEQSELFVKRNRRENDNSGFGRSNGRYCR